MRALVAMLGLTFVHAATAAPAPAAGVFERLAGTWQGSGEVRGMPAEPRMDWQKVFGGRFMYLEFDNRMHNAEGAEIRFRAHGYYRLEPDGATTGIWLDSRGVILPLAGTIGVDGTTLTIDWGDEASVERGRTEYRLDGDRLEVTDEVLLLDGTWRTFGRTTLTRVR